MLNISFSEHSPWLAKSGDVGSHAAASFFPPPLQVLVSLPPPLLSSSLLLTNVNIFSFLNCHVEDQEHDHELEAAHW